MEVIRDAAVVGFLATINARDGCVVDDTWTVSVIPSVWTTAAYKRQVQCCTNVQRFEIMFSDGRSASMYDGKSVKYNADIGSWNIPSADAVTCNVLSLCRLCRNSEFVFSATRR